MFKNSKLYLNSLLFIYIFSIFFSASLKNLIPYINFADELAFCLIIIYFLFYFSNNKSISFLTKNISLLVYSLYILTCFIAHFDFTQDTFLRLKYYIINIAFLILFFFIIDKEKANLKYNPFFLIFFLSIFFGIINFFLSDNFLDFFYNNPNKIDVSYHNKNIRLVSILNSPIIFSFVLNLSLIILLFSKTKNNFYIIFYLIIIFLVFFTFSKLGYICLFFTIIHYLLSKKNLLLLTIFLFFISIFLIFRNEIFLIIYNNFDNYSFTNYFISILKRLNEILEFKSYQNYFLDFYKLDLQNLNLLQLLFGNGFSNLGWTSSKIYIETSLLIVFYEVGLLGLLMCLFIIIKYIILVFKTRDPLEINLLILFVLYILFNNGFVYNPVSFLFFLNYFRLKYKS